MLKKGQITVFIVLGIFILIGAVVLFWMNASTTEEELSAVVTETQQAEINFQVINTYVESCLKQTAEEAMLDNGRRGGYFHLPETSTQNIYDNVPYFIFEGDDLFLNEYILAEEIAAYVDSMLFICLDGFSGFTDQGYTFSDADPKSTAILGPELLSVDTVLPLEIRLGNQLKYATRFKVTVDAEQYYDNIIVARRIVSGVNGSAICLTCFSEEALRYDIFAAILPLQDNTYLIDLQDRNYDIHGEPFHFRFGINYADE